MNLTEFITKTATLEEFYEKKFNQTQRDIWYDELKSYSADRYEKAIDKDCKTLQYRPSLSAMIEAIQHVSSSTTEKEKVECKACKGTGYILYHKIINGHDCEYASLCNCPNAIGLEYDGAKIAETDRRSKYYLEKVENIFMR